MHGLVALDDDRPSAAPGDPLERPAHRRGMRGDRGARRPRAPDRAHGQPSASRLHRAEAPLAPSTTSPTATPASRGSACPRTTCACGSPARGRSTSPTPRARCSSTSPGVAGADEVVDALEIPEQWLPPALESPDVSGETATGIPVAAGAGDQQSAALGVGITGPGPASLVLGTSGVVFAALPEYRTDQACTRARRSVTRFPVPGRRWG